MSTARVDFTRGAAERIANVVRLVEQGDRDGAGLTFRKADVPAGGKAFRVCTFTGAWNINSSKTLTLRNVTSTPNTVVAVNLFASIAAPTGTASCAIARDGTAWYVIAAQCS